MSDAIAISVSGLQASSMWMDAVASNLANARDESAVPTGATSQQNPGQQTYYQPVTVSQMPVPGGGVEAHLTPVQPASTISYDPSSPSADQNGMVAMPNVDLASQFVNMTEAVTSYKANLAVMKTADKMMQATLDMKI
jgi:flagellar basal-body rod protein FlgC